AAVAVVLALGLIAALARIPTFRPGTNSMLFNVVGYSLSVIIFSSVLVVALSSDSGFLYRALSSPPLRFIGRISYTMYLVHEAMLVLSQRVPIRSWLQRIVALG